MVWFGGYCGVFGCWQLIRFVWLIFGCFLVFVGLFIVWCVCQFCAAGLGVSFLGVLVVLAVIWVLVVV